MNSKFFALVSAAAFVACVNSPFNDGNGFHKGAGASGGAGGDCAEECDCDGDNYVADDCVDGNGNHGDDCDDHDPDVYPGHGCGNGSGGSGNGGSGNGGTGNVGNGGTGNTGNAPPSGDMVTVCYNYTAPAGYQLAWGEVHFWTLQQPDGDYTDLNKEVGGDPNWRQAVAVYVDGEDVEFSVTVVKVNADVYYAFDVCDYPGAYCEGNDFCVSSVGHVWVTKGNCETQNPTVIWDSNTATIGNGGKVDNPDGLDDCTANGQFTVHK